jgi:hypothetical protein
MDLQMPPAVSPVLDVNSIVKIARGLAVDGDNGQMAKILAPLRSASLTGCARRFASSRTSEENVWEGGAYG